nr:MltA domain-containing protein [Methylibium sp.]
MGSPPAASGQPPAPQGAPVTTAPGPAPAMMAFGISRWVAAPWNELPGWPQDNVLAAWPALLKSCERPAPGWQDACAEARSVAEPDEAKVRAWLTAHLQPWRVESPEGQAEGMITGYYEPLIEASRSARPGFTVPLYGPPADLATRKPWFTREQVERDPAARSGLRGREIAFVADPLDALVLHIQGSGRLAVTEPDGQRRLVRAAFAGHNDQPYKSVGRWLVDRGAFTLEQASWPAIKSWARAHPRRVEEMLNANPRYVFFREEPLIDPSAGPRGAQGVALTPGRSIAVDKRSVPYGSPVWIDTTEPQPWSAANPPPPRPLQRLVVAQDTGGAITGPVRADYFWGWGDGAEARAGRMKQPLRMWVLWPKVQTVGSR